MALTSFSGSSQVALSPRHTAAAEDVLSVALARSDANLDDETQRTVLVFGRYRSEIQERLAAQAAEIRQLRELLVAANARPRELTIAHEERTRADQERIAILERRAVTAEVERDNAARIGVETEAARVRDIGLANARAAMSQREALAAREETSTVRTESTQQAAAALAERNAAIAAERQRGDALVAAERQTAQEERVRQERLTKLALQEAEDTCKMQKFLGDFYTASKALPSHPYYVDCLLRDPRPCSNQVPVQLKALQELINQRLERSIDSMLNREIQQADTLKLENLPKLIMCAIDANWPPSCTRPANSQAVDCRERMLEPLKGILTPLIEARKARIR